MNKIAVLIMGLAIAAQSQAQNSTATTSTTTTATSATATGSGSSTVAAPAVAAKPKKPWSVTLIEQVSQGLQVAKDKGGAATLTQLSFSYKVNDKWRLGTLGYFTANIAGRGEEQSQELTYGDIGLTASTQVPALIGSDPASLGLRVYLPTSEASVDLDQQAYLRADYSLATPSFGKWNGEGLISARSALRRNTPDTGMLIVQPSMRYTFNDKVSSYGSVGYILMGKNDNALKRTSELAGPEVGLDISVASTVDLSMAVSQMVEIHNTAGQGEYVFFDTDSTEYSLTGIVRF